MVDRDHVQHLVAEQLAIFHDPTRRAAFVPYLLAEPRLEEREWDYGEPGERYPYWVIAEAPAQRFPTVRP